MLVEPASSRLLLWRPRKTKTSVSPPQPTGTVEMLLPMNGMSQEVDHTGRIQRMMPRLVWLVLLTALVLAAVEIPDRFRAVQSALRNLEFWPDRAAQTGQVVGTELYDTLASADRVLPRNAIVLLVTAGTDVRHKEYIAFHRALYFLAPRPVWWVAPVERDGTWESRWWTPVTLSPQALTGYARTIGATHVLALGVERAAVPGQWVSDFSAQGQLFVLPGAERLIYEADDLPEI